MEYLNNKESENRILDCKVTWGGHRKISNFYLKNTSVSFNIRYSENTYDICWLKFQVDWAIILKVGGIKPPANGKKSFQFALLRCWTFHKASLLSQGIIHLAYRQFFPKNLHFRGVNVSFLEHFVYLLNEWDHGVIILNRSNNSVLLYWKIYWNRQVFDLIRASGISMKPETLRHQASSSKF